MLVSTAALLKKAQAGGYAIGAFNAYNLEGVQAVVSAAEAERSPVILQVHPGALQHGRKLLIALCLAAAQEATVPVSVHLDHSAALSDIEGALKAGLRSIMADGSQQEYHHNVEFTRQVVSLVHQQGGVVEGELGRLSGTEDRLTVPEYESRLTDPAGAAEFVSRTGIDALAVCIGNVHGNYRSEPKLDFDRLAAINHAVTVPLVLHGASGLPEGMIRRSVELGVCKFNVNTEVRQAYLSALKAIVCAPRTADLVEIMQTAISQMHLVVRQKLRLFGSLGKATP